MFGEDGNALPVINVFDKFTRRWFLRESFPFDLTQIEPAVVTHKINYRVELLVYEVGVVADYWYTDDGEGLAVLVVNFWNWDVESAFEPAK